MNRSLQNPKAFSIEWALALLALMALACSATPVSIQIAALPTGLPTQGPGARPSAGPGVRTLSAVLTATAFQPASPSATVTVTETPSPSPTLTPSPSATPSPTPTHTPTQTLTPSITPTETITPTPEPTLTPIFLNPDLPAEAAIWGISGYDQAMPLSCESRSAVDWAAYFGVYIDELVFQSGLYPSDNPNTGFVGDPNGETGQIPPLSYGVHAPPVAALLRNYGLNAQSRTGLTPDDLRSEIAQGRPVIAWVIGHVWLGYAQTYTASNGETLLVAPYEHTVIVTAYTPDSVTVLDGGQVYSVSWELFLASWSVLDNMGVFLSN